MNFRKCVMTLSVLAATMLSCAPALADYVLPMIGGGQTSAPMKHADVMFDGTNLTVHIDDTVGTPMLRPLTPPDEFDPAEPWAVLSHKAYNYQYAWNPGGFITLPGGTGIWIERLSHSAGLETFLRSPATPAWAPVFTADGERWQWGGSMTHNAYAVLNPAADTYSATYRVYIGDATTGEPLAGYGSTDVTWTWDAEPTAIPEPAAATALALLALTTLRRR